MYPFPLFKEICMTPYSTLHQYEILSLSVLILSALANLLVMVWQSEEWSVFFISVFLQGGAKWRLGNGEKGGMNY